MLLALDGGLPLLLAMKETARRHNAEDVADDSRELHIRRVLPSSASERDQWSEAWLNILALVTSVKDDIQSVAQVPEELQQTILQPDYPL